jgi:hypothetical protein
MPEGVVMRKIVIMLVLGLVLSGLVFAADGYVVQSVSGKVEREVSPGKWEAVTVGMTLSPAVVINTSLNSQLELEGSGKTVTIKAMQKGTVETLAGGASASGLRISGKVTESKTGVSSRGTSNISTASTRASDAAAGVEWVEE